LKIDFCIPLELEKLEKKIGLKFILKTFKKNLLLKEQTKYSLKRK